MGWPDRSAGCASGGGSSGPVWLGQHGCGRLLQRYWVSSGLKVFCKQICSGAGRVVTARVAAWPVDWVGSLW